MSSALNINTVALVGQLTTDPVLKALPDGRPVCELRLAVNDRNDQPPMFIDVSTFGSAAEACGRYLAKGRQIAVTGRLAYHEWQTKDGSKRSKHHIVGRVAFGARDLSDENQVLAGGEESDE